MAKVDDRLESIDSLTVVELADLVKKIEEQQEQLKKNQTSM